MTLKKLSILLVIFTLCSTTSSFAQEAVDSVKVLQLLNVSKGKSKLIFRGEKVIYKLKSENSKKLHKGNIDLIDDQGIIVSGNAVKLNDIAVIMSKTHRKVIRFAGGSTVVVGGILVTSGTALMILKQGISPYIGVIGLITGIPTIIAGIATLTHSNHYSEKKGWKPEIVWVRVYKNEEDF